MRIAILAVGRMKQGPERELCARYLDRAQAGGKTLGLSGFAVAEIPESRAGSSGARKTEEARALTELLAATSVRVALDERGNTLSSDDFARKLGRWRDDGRQGVAFVIGGADGLDPQFVKAADVTLSFSPLTWPHQLVRIMLAEQLYRATTILSGHPYHRE
ncbi:MAG: 23S rRNA (pseudouridine(1915)-N(3))-methyltransferase RlmH [Devosia sp.]